MSTYYLFSNLFYLFIYLFTYLKIFIKIYSTHKFMKINTSISVSELYRILIYALASLINHEIH